MDNFKGLSRRFENLMGSFTPEQKEKLLGPNSRLISEEIDRLVNNIPSSNLVGAVKQLKESYNVLNSLKKVTSSDFDPDSEIITENWNFFTSVLKEMVNYEPYQQKSKEAYNKLYAVKFFTKADFVDKDSIEDNLKHGLKKHFSKLVTNDPEEFTEALFKLPFDFVGLVVRYVANELAPDEKEKIIPKHSEAEAYLEALIQKKRDFIELLSKIAYEQNNVLSISDASLLVDTRSFIEDLDVNSGALEYLLRLINNKSANEKLSELFGAEFLRELKQSILAHPNYKKYLQQIKHSETQPFFNVQGLPNEGRSPSFKEVAEDYVHPELALIRQAQETDAAANAAAGTGEGPVDVTAPPEVEPEVEQVPVVTPAATATPAPTTPGGLSAEIPAA